MTMACRALIAADYDDARALYAVLASGDTLPDRSTGETAFEHLLAHPGTMVFGADVDERVVSMATLHLLPNITYAASPYALIENVATLSDHRGRGYGGAVMRFAADHAWGAGAYKIMLLTGRANDAEGFYTRLGYNADEKFGMIQRRPSS